MVANLSRAYALMEEYRLDAVVAADPVTLRYLQYDIWLNFEKEWNHKPGGADLPALPSFCVIPLGKSPIYVVNAQAVNYVENHSGAGVESYGPYVNTEKVAPSVVFGNAADAAAYRVHAQGIYADAKCALESVFVKNGLQGSRVGWETNAIAKSLQDWLGQRLRGCRFLECSEFFRLVRMIKTEEEIDLIRRSLDLNEKALARSVAVLGQDKLFGSAQNFYLRCVCEQGALPNHFAMFSRGLGLHEVREYRIEKDSTFALDCGCRWQNYTSDTAMTVVSGRPPTRVIETYQKVLEVFSSGIRRVRPGSRCSEIYKAMVATRERLEINECLPDGHGIGVNHHEYPKIANGIEYEYFDVFRKRSADFTLEAGMIINLEVPTPIYGEASYSIEKTIQVTTNGAAMISVQLRDAPLQLA